MTLKAITPRFPLFNADHIDQMVKKSMKDFGTDTVAAMGKYPPARPWKNPPRTGPRAGGRRTGNLGRNWTAEFRDEGGQLVSGAYNNVTYARYVVGPEGQQTSVMAARGWQPVDKEANIIWNRTLTKVRAAIAGK